MKIVSEMAALAIAFSQCLRYSQAYRLNVENCGRVVFAFKSKVKGSFLTRYRRLQALETDWHRFRRRTQDCHPVEQDLLQRRDVPRRDEVSPERLRDVDPERPASARSDFAVPGAAEMHPEMVFSAGDDPAAVGTV